jgi:hypothetical protein
MALAANSMAQTGPRTTMMSNIASPRRYDTAAFR